MYTWQILFLCQLVITSRRQEVLVGKTDQGRPPWSTLVFQLALAIWHKVLRMILLRSRTRDRGSAKRFLFQLKDLKDTNRKSFDITWNWQLAYKLFFKLSWRNISYVLPTQEKMNSHCEPHFSLSLSSGSLFPVSEFDRWFDVSPSRPY